MRRVRRRVRFEEPKLVRERVGRGLAGDGGEEGAVRGAPLVDDLLGRGRPHYIRDGRRRVAPAPTNAGYCEIPADVVVVERSKATTSIKNIVLPVVIA